MKDLSNNKLYYKEGNNYFPVGREKREVFYSDGIWIVEDGASSASRIMKIGELPDIYPLANLRMRADQITKTIQKYFVEKNQELLDVGKTKYGAYELTLKIIGDIARVEIEEKIIKNELLTESKKRYFKCKK